jgi:hypothetical protein
MKIGLKVRTSGLLFAKAPFKRDGGPASDILGSFAPTQTGSGLLAKSAKTTRPFSEAGGGGGGLWGERSPANLKFYRFLYYV